MRENTESNEALLSFLEAETKKGKTIAEARKEAITHFHYGGKNPNHSLRAHLARLSDPAKYGGKYSERAKKFQQERNNKKTTSAPIEAVGEVTVETNTVA